MMIILLVTENVVNNRNILSTEYCVDDRSTLSAA